MKYKRITTPEQLDLLIHWFMINFFLKNGNKRGALKYIKDKLPEQFDELEQLINE